jgi:hypothetical protein
MKTFGIGCAVVALILFLVSGAFLVAAVGALNKEASLRASIEAHEKRREASFDTMKKIIVSKTQLPAAAREDLLKLLPEVVAGRAGGSVFKSVQENYPQFTLSLYEDLSRSIEAERHLFFREQSELLDVQREHNSLLNSVFGGTVCRLAGRRPVEIQVISSTEAKEVVRTGVDDTTKLDLK